MNRRSFRRFARTSPVKYLHITPLDKLSKYLLRVQAAQVRAGVHIAEGRGPWGEWSESRGYDVRP